MISRILRKPDCAEVWPSKESRRQQDFCFLKIWTTPWSPDIWQRNRSSNNRRDVVSFELRIFNQLHGQPSCSLSLSTTGTWTHTLVPLSHDHKRSNPHCFLPRTVILPTHTSKSHTNLFYNAGTVPRKTKYKGEYKKYISLCLMLQAHADAVAVRAWIRPAYPHRHCCDGPQQHTAERHCLREPCGD